MKWISRRALLRVGIAGAACAGPYGYGATRGRTSLVAEHCDCPLSDPEEMATANADSHPPDTALEGLKIAVMADFHFDETHDSELMAAAVELCNSLDPDITLLPGDFISHDPTAADGLAEQLQHLRASLGVFASSGNHDHWSGIRRVEAALENVGIEMLRNESRALDYAGRKVAVVGLESVWGGNPDYHYATLDLPADVPRILTMHEPDYFDKIDELPASLPRPVLQVSGHTHGGQVCAPFVGPILLPSWGKKYPAGLYGSPGRQLYVTRGVGTIGPSARFFCRPEVTLLTLRA